MSDHRTPSDRSHVRIGRAVALDRYRVQIGWLEVLPRRDGSDVVDLKALIEGDVRFALLWDQKSDLWERIHPAKEGRALAWGDAPHLDISADTIQKLASAQNIERGRRR